MGEEEVRAYLTHLAVEQHVAASTQNQALAALTFLYEGVLERKLTRIDGIAPARRPRRLPVVPAASEVRQLLAQLREPVRLCGMLMYGSGLRLHECLTLRVKDIDFDNGVITLHGGKGDKDRRVPLPRSCVGPLRRHLAARREVHRRDVEAGTWTTGLAEALCRKYPAAPTEWGWAYLFAAQRTFVDATGRRRRHHLHDTVLQRAVRVAAQRAGLTKRVSCHSLRHSFATHLLQSGTDIRTIQELMGHTDLRTTMIYTHIAGGGALGVTSPVDRL